MSKQDGGSAFPIGDMHGEGGMSLRDYFMAHAPAAEIAELVPDSVVRCADYIGIPANEYSGIKHYAVVLAVARAKWADAMLAERTKAGSPETDAEMCDGWSGDAFAVSVEFARKLERQRDQLKAALAPLYEHTKWRDVPIEILDNARAALAEVK